MHEFTLLKQQAPEQTPRDFFLAYCGPKLLKILDDQCGFCDWPEHSVQLFKEILDAFADILPRFDHVIRLDAGKARLTSVDDLRPVVHGPLLFYVGIVHPLEGNRTHYLSVAFDRQADRSIVFHVYVGGSPDGQEVRRIIQEEDPQQKIEGYRISSIHSLQELMPSLRAYAKSMEADIVRRKGAVRGFSALHSWEIKEQEKRWCKLDNAIENLKKFYQLNIRHHSAELHRQLNLTLRAENEKILNAGARLVFDGYPLAHAWKECLEMAGMGKNEIAELAKNWKPWQDH